MPWSLTSFLLLLLKSYMYPVSQRTASLKLPAKEILRSVAPWLFNDLIIIYTNFECLNCITHPLLFYSPFSSLSSTRRHSVGDGDIVPRDWIRLWRCPVNDLLYTVSWTVLITSHAQTYYFASHSYNNLLYLWRMIFPSFLHVDQEYHSISRLIHLHLLLHQQATFYHP